MAVFQCSKEKSNILLQCFDKYVLASRSSALDFYSILIYIAPDFNSLCFVKICQYNTPRKPAHLSTQTYCTDHFFNEDKTP
jgi:hypothetical protein